MRAYKSRYARTRGLDSEVIAAAREEYRKIQKRTPRRHAYIKSKYFNKKKVFVGIFWEHLKQKSGVEQTKRLKYYRCAIDLIRNSTNDPETIVDSTNNKESLYRFYGQSQDGTIFCVQIKQQKRSGRKDFMSVFQVRKK
jgi:hypothetical protein